MSVVSLSLRTVLNKWVLIPLSWVAGRPVSIQPSSKLTQRLKYGFLQVRFNKNYIDVRVTWFDPAHELIKKGKLKERDFFMGITWEKKKKV